MTYELGTFKRSLAEHTRLFWTLLRLGSARNMALERLVGSGLMQKWESAGPDVREAVWEVLWRETYGHLTPPPLQVLPPSCAFVLFRGSRHLGALLVLEEMRLICREDAYETVNALRSRWSRDAVLRELVSITRRKWR